MPASDKIEWTLSAAIMDFFKEPKVTITEMKNLDDNDKAYFKRELAKVGYNFATA